MTIENTELLSVNKLSRQFNGHAAVDEISFHVDAGEIVCLLGANGAGKSTTINMLLGFIQPNAGRAAILGNDTWHDARACRVLLFYLPENAALYPELSAIENIEYFCALAKIRRNKQQIHDTLVKVGLASAALKKPLSEYSKGMRQKVAIAFAVLKEARLLLMDEPTSGLDPKAIRNFIQMMTHIKQRGAAVLMVTHDLQCAHLLATRIGIMNHGRLLSLIDNRTLSLDELEQRYFAHF